MRHTLFSIYNKVAGDVGDTTFLKLTRQEYLTAAGEIALDISRESHMFIQQKQYVANGGETMLMIHSDHALFADLRQMRLEFDPKCILNARVYETTRRGSYKTAGLYIPPANSRNSIYSARVYDDFEENYDYLMLMYDLEATLPVGKQKFPNGDMFKPLYVLKAMRGTEQLVEHSYDAIVSANYHRRSFHNDVRLGRRDYAIRKLNADSAYYANRYKSNIPVIVNEYPVVYDKDTETYYQNEAIDPTRSFPIVYMNTDSASGMERWVFADATGAIDELPILYDVAFTTSPQDSDLTVLSESMALFFAVPLEKGEVLTIDFVTQMPIQSELHVGYSGGAQKPKRNSYEYVDSDGNGIIEDVEHDSAVNNSDKIFDNGMANYQLWVPFEDNTVIPDVLQTAFYKGIRWSIVEKLYMREGGEWGNKLVVAKREYESELNKLAAYQRNVKDLSTTVTIQPYKFLEGDW